MSSSYAVRIEPFAERHYISRFRKKHKGAWEATETALVEEFKRVEALLGTSSVIEVIRDAGDVKVCKSEFRVAGTNQSRHGSGNRCIVAVHAAERLVRVLLVYHKGDLRGPSETAAWKAAVKEAYPEYAALL